MPEQLPPLKQQEIPYDHPESTHMFQTSSERPLVTTKEALEMYQREVILCCLEVVQQQAQKHQGIDYLQVFDGKSLGKPKNLWFVARGEGGAVTALLPSRS